MCPRLLRRLWRLLKVVWRKGSVPGIWKKADGVFIPKEKVSKSVGQFRTISLLNVEGKIFNAILAKRLTRYITENKYLDISVQKGGVPGFSGCLEHISAITQLIREARVNQGELSVVWLDMANAYGSIPHKLIEKALNHYHVPESVTSMIIGYLCGTQIRFRVADKVTRWQPLEKGIVTGCTISVVLFVMGFNLIVEAVKQETRGPKTASGIRLPSNRGFMDDLTLTTVSPIQSRWMLATLDELVTWARMQFKAKKSRCLVIRKGKVTNRFALHVQGVAIPSLMECPIKCLGKWFDSTLKDKGNVQSIKDQLRQGLLLIDKTCLPGKFKCWLYQYGLLPRLLWPLTLYEITTSVVEGLERTINRSIRRWLGLPPSFTSIGLYGRSNQLQLPLSSFVEEFKVAKARLVVTLKESKDDFIRKAGIETRTGRKWSASQAVSLAESRLAHSDIVGNLAVGRQGLGMQKSVSWKGASAKERRGLIQAEVRAMEEEDRKAKAVQLGSQGAWTAWVTEKRVLKWSDMWKYEPIRISFLLRSVYNTLPSPANLYQWKLREDPNCILCGRKGTMAHILSSCTVSLSQGRYRWRHDTVLRQLSHYLEKERSKVRKVDKNNLIYIQFVKGGEGDVVTSVKQKRGSLFDQSETWEMRVDLDKRLVFPEVVQTTLRPDIVLFSRQRKLIVLVELTVPWETRVESAHELKTSKYAELLGECRAKGWRAWLFPVEVGTRGFAAPSLSRLLSELGLSGRMKRVAVQNVCQAAERASSWLWLRREELSWKPSTGS